MIEDMARQSGCTELQVWTLCELANGRSIDDLADERGVTARGMRRVRNSAFQRVGDPRPLTNRHKHVLALRRDGHTWDYIAVEMRISRQAAHRLFKRACKREGIPQGAQHG